MEGLAATQFGEIGVGPALPAASGVPFGLSVPDEEHMSHGGDGTAR